jgi:hypothetical protein
VARVAADWPAFREATAADAEVARRRSAPGRYARELVAAVTALQPAGDVPAPDLADTAR